MVLRKTLVLLTFLALGACSRQVFNDHSVVGPDLPRGDPFGGHAAVLTQNWSRDGARSIRFAPGQDATVVNFFSNTAKPYNAGVGAWSFTPIVPETNAEAHHYWLLSFNLTRTADRSNYLILRYPASLELKPGTSSDAFEYLSLDCGDLDVARRKPESYASVKEGESKPDLPLDIQPEAGDCEFNSLHEAQVLAPLVLKKYDLIKRYDDAPTADWRQVRVVVE